MGTSSAWLIERWFVFEPKYIPIKGEVYVSKKDAEAAMGKLDQPHMYRVAEYRRVEEPDASD